MRRFQLFFPVLRLIERLYETLMALFHHFLAYRVQFNSFLQETCSFKKQPNQKGTNCLNDTN